MGFSKQHVVFILSGLIVLSIVFQIDFSGKLKISGYLYPKKTLLLLKNTTLRQNVKSLAMRQNLTQCALDINTLKTNVSLEKRQQTIAADPAFLNNVQPGGVYMPADCKPKGNVAVIVPYRDREEQLHTFLRHMHHFLQTQKIAYTIFIIEMIKGIPFNRGMLMNVGFHVATRLHNFTCFVFHDVDLVPTNERNLYDCPDKVRHIATGNSKNKYKVPYPTYLGGVVSFNEKQYRAINGFSNLYFGWGLEDDDLNIRVKSVRLPLLRLDTAVGRYTAMNHSIQPHDVKPLVERKELIRTSRTRRQSEGLNSLVYTEVKFALRDLYTWVLVDINKTDLHNRYLMCNKKGWPCDFKHIKADPRVLKSLKHVSTTHAKSPVRRHQVNQTLPKI